MYPNPANNLFTVESKSTNATISIISLNGKVLLSEKMNGYKTNLDINSLATGMYIVEVKANDSVSRMKVVKE